MIYSLNTDEIRAYSGQKAEQTHLLNVNSYENAKASMRKIQKVSVQQGGSGHQKDVLTSNEKYLENPDIEEYLKQEEEIEKEIEREETESRGLLPKKSHLEAALDTVKEI